MGYKWAFNKFIKDILDLLEGYMDRFYNCQEMIKKGPTEVDRATFGAMSYDRACKRNDSCPCVLNKLIYLISLSW